MATDAEITLKFTAEIQEALKAIRMLRDEIEKIKAAGGFLSPEDMELISEMKAKLDEYTRTVRELQIEYYRLQQRNGEMSAEFIAQATNLRQQIIETQRQVSNLTEKYEKQGAVVDSLKKRVKELEDGHKKTEDNGIHAYGSLRTAIAHFIVNLAKGKLAVNELGMALKGLAYSTVILGAISLAMDGIRLAWDAVKGVFGQSKEAMEEAKRKAEEAEEQLKQTKEAAVQADNAIRDARRELAREDEQNALKQMIDASIESLREEKRVADELLDTINEQAEAEAVKRALATEQERHEYAMKRLELDRQRITGQLSTAQYSEAVEKLGYQEREGQRTREREEMEAKVDAAEKRLGVLETTLNNARIKADALEAQLANYLSDKEIAVMEKDFAALKTRQEAAVRRYKELGLKIDEQTSLSSYKEAEELVKNGKTPVRGTVQQAIYDHVEELKEQQAEIEREVEMYGNLVNQQEQELQAAKNSTTEREKIAAQLKELQSQETQLVSSTKNAKKEADRLAKSYTNTRKILDQRSDSDWSQTQSRIGNIREQEAVSLDKEARQKRQNQLKKADSDYQKQQQRKKEMRDLAADIAEEAQIAAASTDRNTDDKAVLDKIRKAKEKYGAVFDKVLAQQDGIVSAVEMLQASTERNEKTLNQLQSRIDKLIKQGKVQDTRNRKRSSL